MSHPVRFESSAGDRVAIATGARGAARQEIKTAVEEMIADFENSHGWTITRGYYPRTKCAERDMRGASLPTIFRAKPVSRNGGRA